MFVGYPRSGHSLVGAIIDAHPHAIMAHELNALVFLKLGYSKNQLFYLLEKQSQAFAKADRQWSGYSYHIPGMWQGRYESLQLIGDKRGSSTMKVLAQHPELLDKAASLCPNFKLIHVIRNPFDSISTSVKIRERERKMTFSEKDLDKKIGHFFSKAKLIQEIKQRFEVLDVYHEALIAEPKAVISQLFKFLNLDLEAAYLDKIAAIINPRPHNSRFEQALWTPTAKDEVMQEMGKYTFFAGYHFDS